jgi:hypothetical protein
MQIAPSFFELTVKLLVREEPVEGFGGGCQWR